MEPDTVPLSVRSRERWKFRNTRHTTVSSVERIQSSAPALEFGIADRAEKWLRAVHTRCLQRVPFKRVVTSTV